jgi:hypothetical protein
MASPSAPLERWHIFLIAGLIIVAVLVVRHVIRQSQQRARFVATLAASQGWAYARVGDDDLKKSLDTLFPPEEFNPGNVATVSTSGRPPVALFECSYSARGRRSMKLGAGALVATGAIGPGHPVVEIVASTLLDEVLTGKKVDVEDTTFRRHYFVQSADSAAARRLAGPALRGVLTRHAAAGRWPRARINLGHGHVALLISAMEDEQAWLDVLSFMRDIEAALDEQVAEAGGHG